MDSKDTTETTTAHAYAAYGVEEDPTAGPFNAETVEWYIYRGERASELADSEYARLVHRPDTAVTRYTIEVPSGLMGEAWEEFVDEIEWDSNWAHPAVTIVRENETAERLRLNPANL